jgi:biopolymer transport protein ExbB
VPAANLCALALVSLAFASPAHAWWDSEWTLRKKIVLDTSATGAAITEAPGTVQVLLRLHEGNFRFTSAKPDGSDLRFLAADEKTLLPYHLEKFDPLLNEAFVWVKVSDLKPDTKTTIWLYYGNAGNKATKVEDAKATYDDTTVLVYHFAEKGSAPIDSSGHGNNAVSAGTTAEGSLIGSGLRLDGKPSASLPSGATLAMSDSAPMTWSAWVRYVSPQANAVIYSARESGRAFVIGVDNGVPYVELNNGGSSQRSSAGAPFAGGGWHHLAVVAASGRTSLFVDGAAYGSVSAPFPSLSGGGTLGNDSGGGVGFQGELDELEISRVARNAGALRLAVAGQGADGSGKFTTVGDDEQETSWLSALKGGYIGVIIGSLTVDGWVVIGILGVMSAVSWVVMIRKATYLNRISKGNMEFLNEWHHVANDLSILESDDIEDARSMGGRGHGAMRLSPLYHLYHIGVEEIQHRLAADQRGGVRVISARSMQAIRASLDGGLVRETQRLNSNIVLLTIAIAGGPFLGLLGTVVGVMITFAAVAQAGDVNVNAIAPGIAAALAATVAGLAVAIPALFGYNYLLTRIKSTSTDMHVFIDEFVTKLAEFYSEPSM